MSSFTARTEAPDTSALESCLAEIFERRGSTRPLSTYRVQFHAKFRFADALKLVDYWRSLGISHLYASPFFRAREGSNHGYDVMDHNSLNPEIGTEAELLQLSRELRVRGMGMVLDIVPNHMGVGPSTPWWRDVLQNGLASEYAEYFDIDWDPLKAELKDKLLIPVLGDQYGVELEAGHIQVVYEEGEFQVRYYEQRRPVDPQTYPLIFEPLLSAKAPAETRTWLAQSGDLHEMLSLLAGFSELPSHTVRDSEQIARRRRKIPLLQERLSHLTELPLFAEVIRRSLELLNGRPGETHSFDALHRLLEAQVYRLAYWRVSAEEINYRRFFDVNELVGLKMENPQVFAATHKLLRRLLAEEIVTGIRIDHLDGLLNPRQYLIRLQFLYAAARCVGAEPQGEVSENGVETAVQRALGQMERIEREPPLYVVVEKILEPGEELPRQWMVDGTSGYDFMNLVNGVFMDSRNERAFTNLYSRFIGGAADPEEIIYRSKKLIMNSALSSEVNVLTHILDEISSRDRHARDFTRKALRDAIRETIASFPVYRTYIDERGEVTERDRQLVNHAIARAKRLNEGTAAAVFDFLRDILLLKQTPSDGTIESYRRKLYFTLKFQQLTGPVMAKGLEDTACYVYNRFISVNEVGGTPRKFGVSVDEFHRGNLERAERWPNAMLGSSTHDTKRSEDVRARLNVLSEMPKQWSAAVLRWRRMNKTKKRTLGDGRIAPDANEEYLIYQTLVGALPFAFGDQDEKEFTARIQQYMDKALHEAKVNLSWINDNPEYVDAVSRFIERILAPKSRGPLFLEELQRFAAPVAYFGAINSVAQTVLKLAAPGVPDVYQGNEMWDFSLVDPDNRRPMGFEARMGALRELESKANGDLHALCSEVLDNYQDGLVKLWTTMRILCLRQERPELFRGSAYIPLAARGSRADHVCAFARQVNGSSLVVAVPRLPYTLMNGRLLQPLKGVWADTEIQLPARGRMRHIFTGDTLNCDGSLRLSDVLAHFPAAVLVSER